MQPEPTVRPSRAAKRDPLPELPPTDTAFTLSPVRGKWYARIRLPDDTRPGLPVGPCEGPEKMSEERAREKVRSWLERGLVKKLLAKNAEKRSKSTPKGKTIADVIMAWCPLVEKSDLAPATRKGHVAHANGPIKDRFGAKTAEQLTTPELRAWLREMKETLSASRVRNIFFTLSKMIDDAAAEGWITVANPCRIPKVREELPSLEAPDDDDKAHHTEQEAYTLITSTKAPERRARYLLAFTTLMRDGELAGLTWGDLVTEHGIPCLKIRRAIAMHGDEGHATRRAPKTKSSKRTIPLHPLAIDCLDAWRNGGGWRAYVGRDPEDADPILPDANGQPWRPKSAEFFRDDLEAAGLPTTFEGAPFEFRSTRRSGATWLEAHGVSGDHIDRLMGHSGQSIRRKHYSAADLDALARAVAKVRLLPAADPMDTPDGHAEEVERQEADEKQHENKQLGHLSSVVEQRFRKP